MENLKLIAFENELIEYNINNSKTNITFENNFDQ